MVNHRVTARAAMRRLRALVLLPALALLLASCSEVEEPKVTITGIEVNGMSLEGVELDLLIDVENPNDFGADVGDLEYRVYLDGMEVARGLQTDRVSIPAGSVVEVAVPVTVVWKGVDKGLKKLLDGEEHRWRLKGNVELSKGPMSKSFSFSESGEFTAPRASDIEIDLGL